MNRNMAIGLGLALVLAYLMTRSRALTASVTTGEWYDTDDYASGSTSYPEGLKNFARAIASAEGFGIPGAIPTICNNPGDLKLGEPSIPGGITQFADVETGWSKLYRQLALIVTGGSAHYTLDTTIAEMGRKYAGGDENWATNVANYLGVSRDARLWEVIV
jgi:hypothetical protein